MLRFKFAKSGKALLQRSKSAFESKKHDLVRESYRFLCLFISCPSWDCPSAVFRPHQSWRACTCWIVGERWNLVHRSVQNNPPNQGIEADQFYTGTAYAADPEVQLQGVSQYKAGTDSFTGLFFPPSLYKENSQLKSAWPFRIRVLRWRKSGRNRAFARNDHPWPGT